jgi:hypothetical protein
MTPQQRIDQFVTEGHPGSKYLQVKDGKLFCSVCKKFLALKRSSLDAHLGKFLRATGKFSPAGTHHQQGIAAQSSVVARRLDLTQAWQVYVADNPGTPGSTLEDDLQVRKLHVLEVLMRQGLPLLVMDSSEFRALLEENNYRLGGADSLALLIPASASVELSTLAKEIKGRWCAFVFDGTTRWAEVYAILAMFVDDLGRLQRRVLKLSLLERSLNSDQLARYIMATLRSMGVDNERVAALISDRASTNTAAVDMLLVFMIFAIFIGCFSHTLNNVGKKFIFDVLDDFMAAFLSMQRSKGACMIWVTLAGVVPRSHNAIRWWALHEAVRHVWDHRDCLDEFVTRCQADDLADRSIARMQSTLDDPASRLLLFLQMATCCDAGDPFVKSTYNLEGDDFLAPLVYEEIQRLETFTHTFQPTRADQHLRDHYPLLPDDVRANTLSARIRILSFQVHHAWLPVGVGRGSLQGSNAGEPDEHPPTGSWRRRAP